jgi:hypothetical protein
MTENKFEEKYDDCNLWVSRTKKKVAFTFSLGTMEIEAYFTVEAAEKMIGQIQTAIKEIKKHNDA